MGKGSKTADFGKFPLAAGRRGVVDYPRSAGRWPGGRWKAEQDIVRELTGSVKRRMEANLPFHPRATKL